MKRATIGWIAIWALMGCGDSDSGGEQTPVTPEPDVVIEADVAEEDVAPAPEDVSDVSDVEEDAAPDVEELSDVSDADTEEPAGPLPNLVINEVVVKAVDNGPDWIELRNLGGTKVNLEGWGIRDQLNAHEYLFPEGAEIPAGGYFVVWGKGSGFDYEMDFSFAIDAEARLFAPDQETLVDKADWEEGDAPAGTSWGRFPDGVGNSPPWPLPRKESKTLKRSPLIRMRVEMKKTLRSR